MYIDRILGILSSSGLNPTAAVRSVAGLPRYAVEALRYRRALRSGTSLDFEWFPVLSDRGASAGNIRGHYFHQDLWAARRIERRRPQRHVDVGSRIDGFVAHLLCFMDVEIIDVRPMTSDVRGLRFLQGDVRSLAGIPSASLPSVSSLHAVEHVGLGRYGDPLDVRGSERAMHELARVLAPGGYLYLSVPVGRPRVCFNAHRVFDPLEVVSEFGDFTMTEFAAIDDSGCLVEGAAPAEFRSSHYACGLFEFQRPGDERA